MHRKKICWRLGVSYTDSIIFSMTMNISNIQVSLRKKSITVEHIGSFVTNLNTLRLQSLCVTCAVDIKCILCGLKLLPWAFSSSWEPNFLRMHDKLHPDYDERLRVAVFTELFCEPQLSERNCPCKICREVYRVSGGYHYAISIVKESSTVVY